MRTPRKFLVVGATGSSERRVDDMSFASIAGEAERWAASRASVGRFLSHAAAVPDYVGQTVALSGAAV